VSRDGSLTHLYQRREWAGPRELKVPRRSAVNYRLRWQDRMLIVALFLLALLGVALLVAFVVAVGFVTIQVLKEVFPHA